MLMIVRVSLMRLAVCVVQLSWLCWVLVVFGIDDAAAAEWATQANAVSTDSPVRRSSPARAVILERSAPEYTAEARAAGLEGTVVLYLEVNRDGQLAKVHLLQSLGMGLDEKAIEAVKHWRFAPGMKDGVPVETEQSVEIPFHLPEARTWGIRRCLYRTTRDKYGTSKGITDPLLINYINPSADSCRADQARAVVNFEIKKDGTTDHVKMALANGDEAGKSIGSAVVGWVFQPGLRKGKREVASGTVEMECHPADEAVGGGSAGPEAVDFRANKAISVPTLIDKIEPDYSEEARLAKLEGTVILSIEIDQTGHAVDMSVIRSVGMGLDEQAMQAVNQWRFRPSMKDGKPVAVWAQVEVKFRLL